MSDLARVTRVRNLLKEVDRVCVAPDHGASIDALFTDVALDRMSRRGLIAYVKLAASRLNLQAEIDLYLALAGCASLSGLNTSQLQRLAAWADQARDRAAIAADCPHVLPAL